MSSGKSNSNDAIAKLHEQHKQARAAARVFKSPVFTIWYFVSKVVPEKVVWGISALNANKAYLALVLLAIGGFAAGLIVDGPQQDSFEKAFELLKICAWWVLLGVLSSIGLGTGLHTFVLYLGPFIASATLAATECNSVSFERYGPLKFICPEDATHTGPHPGFFDIFQLVALEAFLWGAGTAIGELPPYFVARAARLAGQRVAELEEEADAIKQDTSFIGRAKQFALDRLGSMGFFGIMLFASIPNPLFDLAGLTSGHMLVPFWTFFGATLVGKAVVKVSLQAAFVLTVFSKDHLAVLVNFVDNLPFLKGKALEMFENVRKQYHRKAGEEIAAAPARSPMFLLWDVFLGCMIMYFVISLIDSSVQEHLVRAHEEEIDSFKASGDKAKPVKNTRKDK